MMDRPKLVREWVGLRCRLIRDVNNGYARIVKGRFVEVTSTHRGKVNVTADMCDQCGCSWHCSRVQLTALEPIERVAPPNPPRRR